MQHSYGNVAREKLAAVLCTDLITGVPYKAIKNMRENQVLNLLEPYRMQLSSTRKVWDDFVEGQDNLLMTSTALITYFGSWNEVKKKISLPQR